jgi:hypothetical protein
MYACAKGDLELVSLLISNGASVTEVDRKGCSALFYVLDSIGPSKHDLLKSLVNEKCDINLINQDKVS